MTFALNACSAACGWCGRCTAGHEPEPWSVSVYDVDRNDWDTRDDLTESQAKKAFQLAIDAGEAALLLEDGAIVNCWRPR